MTKSFGIDLNSELLACVASLKSSVPCLVLALRLIVFPLEGASIHHAGHQGLILFGCGSSVLRTALFYLKTIFVSPAATSTVVLGHRSLCIALFYAATT